MSANLENSAVATILEKESFYSNTKEEQCQRIFRVTEKGSKAQSISHASLEISPNVQWCHLQGPGLRDKLASRGYKEAKQGSHGEEEFGNRKRAEAAKTAGIPNFSQSH